MATPLVKRNKVKKHPKTFSRHQSDRYIKLDSNTWRKPKGIDNRVRRRFKGTIRMPKCGYGTAKKDKHVLPNGFLSFRVFNVKDLEVLLMHNQKYAAEIAHSVSRKVRKEILERAAQLDVKVLNAAAKIKTEEDE
eukprot:GCRY01000065.1.p1 GENE.GCRY01000065.1~~GCRY01000065.1.p1  ORF type:complete len:144 (-),score=38.73 GCRY01000065.1:71-475(-)